MSRTKQKPSDQQRRHTEIIAKLKEWIAARTPLQIASEGYGIFSIRPLKGDSGDDVMTMRTRQGLVSITGLSPRLRQEARKAEVIFPKDFSPETLTGKKPQP